MTMEQILVAVVFSALTSIVITIFFLLAGGCEPKKIRGTSARKNRTSETMSILWQYFFGIFDV